MNSATLTREDYKEIIDVLHQVALCDSPEKLAEVIVQHAGRLIPSHSCGWIEIHADTGFSHGNMNVPVDPSAVAREMAAVIHLHPVFQAFQQTRDGSARAISDCLTRRAFHASDVYNKFLKWNPPCKRKGSVPARLRWPPCCPRV